MLNPPRGAEPHRRTPIARAGTDINPRRRIAMTMKALNIGLLQIHQIVERPYLAAMRMAGQLQINAVLGGLIDCRRLVRKQDKRFFIITAAQRFWQIGALSWNPARAPVIDTGKIEPVAVVTRYRRTLVAQHAYAE